MRRTEGEVRDYLHRVVVEGKHPSGAGGTFLSEVTTKETCVEAIPRRSFTSDVLFERILIDLRKEGKGEGEVFDSAVPPVEGAPETSFSRRTRPYRLLAGSTLTMTQRPSGMVEAVAGVDAVKTRMGEGVPEGDPLRGEIERLLGLGSLRYMIGPNLLTFENPVPVGEVRAFQDIRPLPVTVGSPGLMYYRGEVKVAAVKDGVARLEISAEVTLDPGANMPPWPPAMAPFRNSLRLQRGVCSGFARISVEKGVLLEDEHRTELDLFHVKPDGTGEIPIPTTVTQSTKLR